MLLGMNTPRKENNLRATIHLRLDQQLKEALDRRIADNDGIGNYSQHVRRAIEHYIAPDSVYVPLDPALKSGLDRVIADANGLGNYRQHITRAIALYVEKLTGMEGTLRAAETPTEYKAPPPKRRQKP